MVQIQRFKSRHITSKAQLRIFWRVLLNAIFEGEIPWKTLTAARAHWPTCPKQLTVPVRLARRRPGHCRRMCNANTAFWYMEIKIHFLFAQRSGKFPGNYSQGFWELYIRMWFNLEFNDAVTLVLETFYCNKLNTQLSILNPS